jgi:hypothetical protein
MSFINESNIFSVLKVGLTLDVSSAGFEALSKLPHLQQFIYGEHMKDCDWEHEVRFFKLCTEYMPHLRVAGHSFDVMSMDDLHMHRYKSARGYHCELVQQLNQPTTLSLQLLNLWSDVLPKNITEFSNLEELVMWNPSSRLLEWCDRHAKLTSLGLYEYQKPDITPVLRALHQVGQRLHSLVLCEFYSSEFSLAEVLQLCPRLKRLKVSTCSVKKDPDQWPEAAFSCLEEACFESVTFPSGFLKKVMIIIQ